MTDNVELDIDDQWVEDEIHRELDLLDDSCLLSDEEQCSSESSPEHHVSSADTKVLVNSWYLYSIFCEDDSN